MEGLEAYQQQNANKLSVLRSTSSVYIKGEAELSFKFEIIKQQKRYYLKKLYSINRGYNYTHFTNGESKFYDDLQQHKHYALPIRIQKTPHNAGVEFWYGYQKKSLFDIINPLERNRENRYSREKFFKFLPSLRQLIEGLQFIHLYHGHGGICPTQILLNGKDTLVFAPFIPKLIELEFNKNFEKNYHTLLPTLYKAPELTIAGLTNADAIKVADVFSLGLCFMHLVCPELTIFEIWKIIENYNEQEFYFNIKIPYLTRMIYLMLSKHDSNRPTLENCLYFIDQVYMEIYPEKINCEQFNQELNSKIYFNAKTLLSIWNINFDNKLYVLKNYRFASKKTIGKVINKKNRVNELVENLGPEIEKFVSRSNYSDEIKGDFMIIYNYSGVNLESFLSQYYDAKNCYKITYSILDFVRLLIKFDLVHTELTLESILYHDEKSINFTKVNRIINKNQTVSRKYFKKLSMRPYLPPELLKAIENNESFPKVSLESVLSYSLGILILKIMYFTTSKWFDSTSNLHKSSEIQSRAVVLQEPFKNYVYHMLNPNPTERLKLSALPNFNPNLQSN